MRGNDERGAKSVGSFTCKEGTTLIKETLKGQGARGEWNSLADGGRGPPKSSRWHRRRVSLGVSPRPSAGAHQRHRPIGYSTGEGVGDGPRGGFFFLCVILQYDSTIIKYKIDTIILPFVDFSFPLIRFSYNKINHNRGLDMYKPQLRTWTTNRSPDEVAV
jgi:hypothetical protein